jgi:2-iminobutanoate/2-iminopropanoate deaminase
MPEIISTSAAPRAIGPYSQAIRAGSMSFLSGQIAIDPATGELVAGDAAAQTTRVMTNLLAVVKAAGHEVSDICRCTIFLKSMDDFAAVNAAYAEALGDHRPARATVEVSRLPKDALVEIDAICASS